MSRPHSLDWWHLDKNTARSAEFGTSRRGLSWKVAAEALTPTLSTVLLELGLVRLSCSFTDESWGLDEASVVQKFDSQPVIEKDSA